MLSLHLKLFSISLNRHHFFLPRAYEFNFSLFSKNPSLESSGESEKELFEKHFQRAENLLRGGKTFSFTQF